MKQQLGSASAWHDTGESIGQEGALPCVVRGWGNSEGERWDRRGIWDRRLLAKVVRVRMEGAICRYYLFEVMRGAMLDARVLLELELSSLSASK